MFAKSPGLIAQNTLNKVLSNTSKGVVTSLNEITSASKLNDRQMMLAAENAKRVAAATDNGNSLIAAGYAKVTAKVRELASITKSSLTRVTDSYKRFASTVKSGSERIQSEVREVGSRFRTLASSTLNTAFDKVKNWCNGSSL